MRLDRFMSECNKATRKETALAAKKGLILVNDTPVRKADVHIDPEKDVVTYNGEIVAYKKFIYIIMNKPQGYVSVTESKTDVPAQSLLPSDLQKFGLFPAGRLDKNTTGLLFLTNDGEIAHRLTSPKHHAEKEYSFTVKFPLSKEDVSALEDGIALDDGYVTKPCRITLNGEKSGTITLTEGKYHQIKRMMLAVHNSITSLCRIRYVSLTIDGLNTGEWRYLTDAEEKDILSHGKN